MSALKRDIEHMVTDLRRRGVYEQAAAGAENAVVNDLERVLTQVIELSDIEVAVLWEQLPDHSMTMESDNHHRAEAEAVVKRARWQQAQQKEQKRGGGYE